MTQDSSIRPGSVRAWALAARPATLSAAFVPVAVGTACAFLAGGFAPGPAFAAMLGAFLLQIGTNLANDVFDYEKGADTHERLGPVRAAQAGLITPAALKRGMIVVFGLAVLVGLYLLAVAGPWIFAIGVASILSGIAYTGGPFPLAYNGLGDVFVMAFFGFVAVTGTAFVQTGTIPPVALWASIPVGALATAILVVNNVRDAVGDAKANKRTVVVRFGRRAGELEYALLLLLAYGTPILMLVLGYVRALALLPLATLPLGISLLRRLVREEGPTLNEVLVGTAKLLLLFGVLFAGGIALSR